MTVLFKHANGEETVREVASVDYSGGVLSGSDKTDTQIVSLAVAEDCLAFVMNEAGATIARYP